MPTRFRRHVLATLALTLCAGSGLAVVPASSGSRLVTIIKGPADRTTAREAVFRLKTQATKVACRLDRHPYRRCGLRKKYGRLRVGAHTFTVRARHRGRTSFVRRKWTVVRPRSAVTGGSGTATAAPLAGGPVAAQGPAPVPPPPPPQPVFADEFDGTQIDQASWDLYDDLGHAGNGARRPSALSLDGQGNLVVTAQMQDGVIVSGGMAHRMDFTYGRVEFRVRSEPDPTGTMNAVVLTWPQAQWAPEFTENDMYETGPVPDNTYRFDTYIHFGTANWQQWMTHMADPTQWHTIAMDWRRDLLRIYVDGQLAFSISDVAVIPDVLHHVCIQLDAMATRTLARPVRMFVDYIRIYA